MDTAQQEGGSEDYVQWAAAYDSSTAEGSSDSEHTEASSESNMVFSVATTVEWLEYTTLQFEGMQGPDGEPVMRTKYELHSQRELGKVPRGRGTGRGRGWGRRPLKF